MNRRLDGVQDLTDSIQQGHRPLSQGYDITRDVIAAIRVPRASHQPGTPTSLFILPIPSVPRHRIPKPWQKASVASPAVCALIGYAHVP